MKTLVHTFNHLTPSRRIKFVIFLPVLCFAAVLDKVIDLAIMLVRWTSYFLANYWKDLLVILAAVAIIGAPIVTIVSIDQTVPVYRGKTYAQAEKYVYVNCHEMTNNFIVAEDGNIKGYVRADNTNIDRLIAVIAENNIANGDTLIQWLSEFRNGDYSNAVQFHNYCWNNLDGEVGYAVDLRDRYK